MGKFSSWKFFFKFFLFLIFFFENIFEIFFWKFFLENFVLKFFFWNFFLIFFFLEKGRYRPSDLDCMRRQDSENIAHWRVIQLFSRRLCVCHCLCIRLCLCICVPNSFLNSYYHKLSENVWVWGCGASRSEIWWDVTMVGQPTEQQGKIGLLSQWTMEGWDEQYSLHFVCAEPSL